ncbi:MAG: argininosuccinate lyase [Woeseiaceae bacterium]|jgi:argininosuccinate lyase|nr:argininosuccinate lyase [Woeseiaceae bacterium]|tara:strand:+ start:595 stop:1779 length:1185 start_codon:yes stop_codon:yes gene_type:complete
MSRLWDKGLPLDQRVLKYTAGEDHQLDARLVAYDIRASIAHAEMLSNVDLLTKDDCQKITNGLKQLQLDYDNNKWKINLEDEDVHTALEVNLTKLIGEVGGRIHLGRSRNDQVLVALRLYMLDAIDEISLSTDKLCDSLDSLKQRQGEIPLPGMTHMQHAMPSSVGLWCEAFIEAFEDVKIGLNNAKIRSNKNPLGSAAGYGTPGLPLDRSITTEKLGFAETQLPVTAAQLSRGKAEAHLLFESTMVMQDLGRLSSDLLLYYTQEFSYIDLAPEVTTGSSIMPQKRNPDVLELIRASTASVHACLNECLMVAAKIPSGFQRDLQKIKAPLFRAIDITIESIEIMAYLISSLEFIPENINLDKDLFAAEEAYKLVLKEGISFREAYRRIGENYKK